MAGEGSGRERGGSRVERSPGSPRYGREEAEAAREVMDRAIRRLNALEYVILLVALILALAGGALVAWVLGLAVGLPFRWGWAGASLLLFIVPGGFAYLRERRSRTRLVNLVDTEPKEPHG